METGIATGSFDGIAIETDMNYTDWERNYNWNSENYLRFSTISTSVLPVVAFSIASIIRVLKLPVDSVAPATISTAVICI